jgi:hypothetical protein
MEGQDNSSAEARYPVPEFLNDSAAYRHFLRPRSGSGRYELTATIIAVALVLGAIGVLAAFWTA